MQNKHVQPTKKDEALRGLGVRSAKKRRALAGQVEYVQVRAGRELLTKGRFAPTVLVGVAGAALITGGDGTVVRVEAPFVVDTWAADQRRISVVTLVTESPSTLLLVDWRYRDTVFASVAALIELSARTQAASASNTTHVIDLTDRSNQLQQVHQ